MARQSFYVDGFNVYHAVRKHCPQHLWLDYHRLAELFTRPPDTLADVVYFSAYARWKVDSWKDHVQYVKALESVGVEVVLGKFKETHPQCPNCRQAYLSHEEKQTDVNLALRVVSDAVLGRYDRAVIVSADGDLVPVWTALVRLGIPAEKRVGILLPIGTAHTTLERSAHFTLHLENKHLHKAQFPDSVPLADGSLIMKPRNMVKLSEEFARRSHLKGGTDP